MFASLIIKTKLGVLTELSDSDTAIERSSCKLNTKRIHLTCFKTQHHSWIKREYRHSIAQSLLKNYLCKVQLIGYNIDGRYKTSRLLDTFHNRTITSTRNMPKRKAYTVREKLELITRIRNAESQAKVARETSIAESTLRGWLKCEGQLRHYADGLQDEDGLKRKKQRTAKDPVLDTAMVNWFAQERQTGLPISGPVVKAQAEIFNKSINGDESTFVASQGWLWRWQKRHGITKHKIVGEKRSADKDSAAQFPPRLLEFLADKELIDEQVYNADESGLFYRMLPNSTLAQKNDITKSEGYKLAKDRVTTILR